MAAPKFAPVPAIDDARGYAAPDHVPGAWMPGRPGEIEGFQPAGERLGYQGPDQGFAIKIANSLKPKVHVSAGESVDDAAAGCLGVALRRASLFSRAPVVHDLTIAFTVWGYFDPKPPADLVALRSSLFSGVAHTAMHYAESRHIADMVPEATLRMNPQQVAAAYPATWRSLVGA
jgi:hypothetical protein